ncbi:MAG: LolA family protein [Caulobacteraceae bacterium]
MHHRFVCAIILVSMVLAGCGRLGSEKTFDAACKKLLELKSYTCDVTMKVMNNKSTMEYKMKHFYISPGKYRVEVVEPEELKGQVTIYDGEHSYIYHPKINAQLVTENFPDSLECDAFIGSFISRFKDMKNVKITKEKDNDNLYMLEFEVPEPNSYKVLERLWIDTLNAVPVKAEIYGADGKTTVSIRYTNFGYNPKLNERDFEIIKR